MEVQTDFKLPEQVSFGLDHASVSKAITRPQLNRVFPTNGTVFGMGGAGRTPEIRFELTSASEWLDPRSLALSFKHATSVTGEAAGAFNYLSDGCPSVFRSISVELGGQTVESIVNLAGCLFNILVYLSASKVWYDCQGEQAGYYLFSSKNRLKSGSLAGVTVPVPTATAAAVPAATVTADLLPGTNIGTTGAAGGDPVPSIAAANVVSISTGNLANIPLGTPAQAAVAGAPADGSGTFLGATPWVIDKSIKAHGPSGWRYTVPLEILGLCRYKRFLPLNMLGKLSIIIQLQDWNKSHVSNCAIAANQGYQLSEVCLQYKTVHVAEALQARMREAILGGPGFRMALTSWDAMSYNFTAAAGGTITIPMAKGKQKLKSMLFVQRDTTNITSTGEHVDTADASGNWVTSAGRPLSTYNYNNLKSWWLQIGDQQYPVIATGSNRSGPFTMANDIQDECFWQLQESLGQWNNHNMGGVIQYQDYAQDNLFILGMNFESIHEDLLSGLDTKSVSGGQIFLNLVFDTGGPYAAQQEVDAFSYFDVAVVVKDGAVVVEQ